MQRKRDIHHSIACAGYEWIAVADLAIYRDCFGQDRFHHHQQLRDSIHPRSACGPFAIHPNLDNEAMVTIIDHGFANVGSVMNLCRKLEIEANLTSDPDAVAKAEILILPGVGSFDAGMGRLVEKQLDQAIHSAVAKGARLVGICLGMQLLFESSEEGVLPGLGIVAGRVVKFQTTGLKVPHMGWNEVVPSGGSDLFANDPAELYYFVHSFHAEVAHCPEAIGICEYGYPFVAAIRKNNVLGFQFHPEKSHDAGARLFQKAITTA